MSSTREVMKLGDAAVAGMMMAGGGAEQFSTPKAAVTMECWRVVEALRGRAKAMLAVLRAINVVGRLHPLIGAIVFWLASPIEAALRRMPRELAWQESAHNVVTTQGKNSVLDVYLRAQTQITSWFCGLISSVSFTAVAAGDTAAQINGTNAWKEAGAGNAPTYTGARKALTFAAASGGSIATSAASSFTFTGSGTVKGMFAVSTSTVDGTTGVLYNAVLFSAPGDRTVVSSDVVNVNVTFTA